MAASGYDAIGGPVGGKHVSAMDLSVIIPCFNEQEVLGETYARVRRVLDEHGGEVEILFVNDGSTDRTAELLDAFAADDPSVVVLHFSRNFGHEAATSAGLHHARGRRALIIDADLQDPPELLPAMSAKMDELGCNILYGVRTSRDGEGPIKKLTSRWFYRFINLLSERQMPVDAGDFRLIDRKVIEAFRLYRERNRYVRGIYTEMGFKQAPFPYERQSRQGGKTKYNYLKLTRLALDIVFYYSNKPLNMSVNLGALSVLVSLGLTIYAFIGHYLNRTPGWASTVIITIFLGGIQLLILGIIGKYIGNIFDEVKARPSYIVDRVRTERADHPAAAPDAGPFAEPGR